jgi:hypothetical protein
MYAYLFAGKCQLCQYACHLPRSLQLEHEWVGLRHTLLCTNHPSRPGELVEVVPTGRCRNFKAAHWLRPRPNQGKNRPGSRTRASRGQVRRIPLGHGLFATVDAADFKWLNKHKWCVCRRHGSAYAVRRTKDGRTVYMHRAIMRAPKGSVVDHIDHNTLNNRRCNLRVCTQAQNCANSGPRGALSGFVGVWHKTDRWVAGITCRGHYYYLGTYDDPVEAAKARDRKAYELLGPYAYLNFPEDYPPVNPGKTRRSAALPRRRSGQGRPRGGA